MEILVYGSLHGLKLDSVYDFAGGTLTIWFGYKGWDNFMKGTFSPDGESLSAGAKWPGGGSKVSRTRLD